jgi:hypothetical protein
MITSRYAAVAVLSAGILLSACDRDTVVAPHAPQFSSSSPVLVECPQNSTQSATAVLGPLGGMLALNGHKLTLPPGAVLSPTEFVMTALEGKYVEIAITAGGRSGFAFLEPVELTIDYSRCTRSNFANTPLRIVKLRKATKEIIKDMGGTDDKVARVVTTRSDSLSSYAIAQ